MEDQNWDGIFLHNLIVDNKIIRAFEIIHAKKLISNVVLRINVCQVLIFRLHTVYNKYEMKKIGNQTREKSQRCCYISALALSCFHKGRATFFRPETIVGSFLHLIMLLFKCL